MRIVVTKRAYDYQACVEGSPELLGYGVNIDSAVKNLIAAHRERITEAVETVVYELTDGPIDPRRLF